MRSYEVRVEQLDTTPNVLPGKVKGPYLAETYPVTTEGRYVVVEVAFPN